MCSSCPPHSELEISFSNETVTVSEGDGFFYLTIVKSGVTTSDITIDFVMTAGSALGGCNPAPWTILLLAFTLASGSLCLACILSWKTSSSKNSMYFGVNNNFSNCGDMSDAYICICFCVGEPYHHFKVTIELEMCVQNFIYTSVCTCMSVYHNIELDVTQYLLQCRALRQ